VDKSTAAARGGWIVFEDECSRLAEAVPVQDLEAASDHPSDPGLRQRHRARLGGRVACYPPGDRSRLIFRLHAYRGRKGETKACTFTG
jgi:hypothetical protein